MKIYCKAYYLRDLRRFQSWNEISWANQADLSDETVVYLWDDLRVVRSPILADQDVLVDKVTPLWREFCLTTLGFEVPADLRYASSTIDARSNEFSGRPLVRSNENE